MKKNACFAKKACCIEICFTVVSKSCYVIKNPPDKRITGANNKCFSIHFIIVVVVVVCSSCVNVYAPSFPVQVLLDTFSQGHYHFAIGNKLKSKCDSVLKMHGRKKKNTFRCIHIMKLFYTDFSVCLCWLRCIGFLCICL